MTRKMMSEKVPVLSQGPSRVAACSRSLELVKLERVEPACVLMYGQRDPRSEGSASSGNKDDTHEVQTRWQEERGEIRKDKADGSSLLAHVLEFIDSQLTYCIPPAVDIKKGAKEH